VGKVDQFNAIQEFIQNAGPDSWMGYADELKEAADLLWNHSNSGRMIEIGGNDLQGQTSHIDKPSVSRTYILLSGLALENILKGFAVSFDPTLVNKGKLDSRLKTHRLLDIIDLCNGLTLSSDETEVCRIAEEAIPYWGRYPVPRTFASMKPEKVATFDFQATFDALYIRLHEQLYLSIRNGWDSGTGARLGELRLSQYEPEMQAEIRRLNRRGDEDS
jgi:hypothetical protein